MTFDATHSVTLKIWDKAALHHTIDSAVSDLSALHNTTTCGSPLPAAAPTPSR